MSCHTGVDVSRQCVEFAEQVSYYEECGRSSWCAQQSTEASAHPLPQQQTHYVTERLIMRQCQNYDDLQYTHQ